MVSSKISTGTVRLLWNTQVPPHSTKVSRSCWVSRLDRYACVFSIWVKRVIIYTVAVQATADTNGWLSTDLGSSISGKDQESSPTAVDSGWPNEIAWWPIAPSNSIVNLPSHCWGVWTISQQKQIQAVFANSATVYPGSFFNPFRWYIRVRCDDPCDPPEPSASKTSYEAQRVCTQQRSHR